MTEILEEMTIPAFDESESDFQPSNNVLSEDHGEGTIVSYLSLYQQDGKKVHVKKLILVEGSVEKLQPWQKGSSKDRTSNLLSPLIS